jgi:hypothetical protein
MDNATLYGRRLFSGGTLGMFVAAGLALLAIFAYAPDGSPATRPVASELASVGLVDDDGHHGLFNVSGLVPGRSATRCLQVQYGGPTPAGTVFFSASEITGGLAANLRLKVEQGTGGGFSSCNGFAGSVIYDGPLSGLVDPDPATPRTTTGWSPSGSDERTYRLTATMKDNVSVQNQNSTATFHWFLVGAPAPEPTQVATTDPPANDPAVAEAEPTVAPVGTSAAAPGTLAPTAARSAAVREQPAPASPSAAPVVAEPEVTDDAGPVAAVRKVLEDLGRDLTEVAVRTSTHSALPVTGLAVLLAFLAVQNRIDRMDPKLAMAPAQDPHLEFHEPDMDPDTDPEPAPRPDEAVP